MPSLQWGLFVDGLITESIGFKHRHAGDQLQPQWALCCRQLQHRAGSTHIGSGQLAIAGHLTELGSVVKDASQTMADSLELLTVESQLWLGKITKNHLKTRGPVRLPKAVTAQVLLQTLLALLHRSSPHQAAQLQLGPSLQLTRQEIGPKETTRTCEQNRLARSRLSPELWECPTFRQLGFQLQIQTPMVRNLALREQTLQGQCR